MVEVVEAFSEPSDRGFSADVAGSGLLVVGVHRLLCRFDQGQNRRFAPLGSLQQGLGVLVGDIGPTGEHLGIGTEARRQPRIRNGQ